MYSGDFIPAEAIVFGDWAVHPARSLTVPGWVVTHVPTGIAMTTEIAAGLSQSEAVVIAAHVNQRIGAALPCRELADALIAEALDPEVA
jgi:cysteine sulfinate desulfinase/cysteine desulfurase-like protein